MYEKTHRWMLQHQLFEGADALTARYDAAVAQ
jgi:hypothetical protein